jgi:hypothetical protein
VGRASTHANVTLPVFNQNLVAGFPRSIETRSLLTLTRVYPRRFTFYVARPTRSIHQWFTTSRRKVRALRTTGARLNSLKR